MLLIVGAHCKGYSEDWVDSKWMYPVLVSIFENSTIIFVFIAGFLYHYLFSEEFSYKQYLRKKFSFVFLPYLIFSIPIIALKVSGISNLPAPAGIEQLSPLYRIGVYLATGQHLLPYWFMPMIFIFYLISPLLHAIDRPVFFKYGFPIIFAIGLFTFRPLNYANPILSFIHFLPIYLFGMMAAEYRNKLIGLNTWIVVSLFFLYMGINILEWTDVITLSRSYTFEQVLAGNPEFNIYKLKVSILCLVLLNFFYLARHQQSKMLGLIGTYSFGIYFIHHYLISFGRFGMRYYNWDLEFNLISFGVYYSGIIILSIVGVYIVKKLFKGHSRKIIGS